jgi:hypothetical protein
LKFGRWDSWLGCSWAYRVFRQHHQELNEHYWSWRPVAQHAQAASAASPPGSATTALFGSAGANDRHVPTPLSRWATCFREAENWLQLAAVMSLSSYIEVYIRAVVRAALESDPGVLIGTPRVVDGLSLVKRRGPDYTYARNAAQCADGTWDSRIGQYKKLFGVVPPGLLAVKADLDKLRTPAQQCWARLWARLKRRRCSRIPHRAAAGCGKSRYPSALAGSGRAGRPGHRWALIASAHR